MIISQGRAIEMLTFQSSNFVTVRSGTGSYHNGSFMVKSRVKDAAHDWVHRTAGDKASLVPAELTPGNRDLRHDPAGRSYAMHFKYKALVLEVHDGRTRTLASPIGLLPAGGGAGPPSSADSASGAQRERPAQLGPA